MGCDPIKRREFLGKSAVGLATAAVGLPLVNCAKSEKKEETQNRKIVNRTLGRTGLKIPVVSFGVMNTSSPDMLQKALDMGIKHYDTAHVYLRGNSEKVIGQIMDETGMRDKITIATKMRFNRDREKNVFLSEGAGQQPGATQENFDEQLGISLERLRTDYVDVLYIHSCYSPEMAIHEDLMKAMVKAKEAGKARFLGVSTHAGEPDVIRAAVDAGIYDVLLVAYSYLKENKDEVDKAFEYATAKGVGIVAMKTHGGNRLNQDENVKINHRAALKWVLKNENVCTTIPGMTTFEQMDLNWGVMEDLTLTDEELYDLQLASRAKDPYFCQQCRACVPTCPGAVFVPNLMRASMYAESYGNLLQAEMTVAELPKDKGILNCKECSSCSASCKNGINIPGRVRSLIAMGFARA